MVQTNIFSFRSSSLNSTQTCFLFQKKNSQSLANLSWSYSSCPSSGETRAHEHRGRGLNHNSQLNTVFSGIHTVLWIMSCVQIMLIMPLCTHGLSQIMGEFLKEIYKHYLPYMLYESKKCGEKHCAIKALYSIIMVELTKLIFRRVSSLSSKADLLESVRQEYMWLWCISERPRGSFFHYSFLV